MIAGKKVGVIIPAAGTGKRMGGSVSKQFLEVAGIPIIIRTLEHFQSSPDIDNIILASDKENRKPLNNLIKLHNLTKVSSVVEGGAERQDSVWNCLQEIEKYDADLILIHDAVRPFISQKLIHAVLIAAKEDGAAIAAVRPKDTIKQSSVAGYAQNTLSREQLWIAQTPQTFQFQIIKRAFEMARIEGYYGTDDANLVERIGMRIRIINGSYDNIKITTPEDIELAQIIAKRFVTKSI